MTRLAIFSLPGDGSSVAVDLFKIKTPIAFECVSLSFGAPDD